MFRFPSGLGRPFVFAHRGAMALAPENTVASFLMAERLGADGVELDVHRTRDGVVAVVHDRWISGLAFRIEHGDAMAAELRVPTADLVSGAASVDVSAVADDVRLRVRLARSQPGLVVGETDWADLRAIPRGYDEEGRPVFIPRLEEVFEALAAATAVDVEIKSAPHSFEGLEYPGLSDDVIGIVRRYHREDAVVVSSFNHHILRRFVAKAPDIGAMAIYWARAIDPAALAAAVPAGQVSMEVPFTTGDDVAACHQAGLKVMVGGLTSPADLARAAEWQADAVTLDDPRWATDLARTP
jgi:glycerophosphoryl diester phosphodiesterase